MIERINHIVQHMIEIDMKNLSILKIENAVKYRTNAQMKEITHSKTGCNSYIFYFYK